MGLAAAADAVATVLVSAGVGTATAAAIAPIAVGVITGAGGGALLGAATGGDPGMGALGGAITGGFIPAGGEILGPSLGATAGSAVGGLAGGALGAGVTGGNPLVGAAEGGISGGISGALSGTGGAGTGGSAPVGASPTAGAGAAGSGAGGGLGASLSSLSGGGADAAGAALTGATTPDALSAAINATAPAATGGLGGTVTPAQMNSLLGITPGSTGPAPITPPTPGAPAAGSGTVIDPAASIQGGGGVPSLFSGPLGAATGGTVIDPAAAVQGAGGTPSLFSGGAGSSGGGTIGTFGGAPNGPQLSGGAPLDAAALAANNLGAGNAGGAGTPTFTAGGSSPLDAITSFTKNHPLLTTGGALLGSQLLSPLLQNATGANSLSPAEQAMLNAQQPGINAANSLVSSLQTGQLPPGADAAVNQALQSDIANIKSRYASMGMSGSSAEQQDIANAQSQAAAQKFQLAQQATQTGLSALGLNQSVYQTLVQDQLAKQQNLSNAISNFFGSVGTGTALGQALNQKSAAA